MKLEFRLSRVDCLILLCNLIGFGAGVTFIMSQHTSFLFLLITGCAGVASVSKLVSAFRTPSPPPDQSAPRPGTRP